MKFLKAMLSAALILGLPLWAQIEPQLKTTTDLADVYKRVDGKPEVVAVYDFTPVSRGVFEPRKYVTTGDRNAFLGNAGQDAGGTDADIVSLFKDFRDKNDANFGKDFGFVFALKKNVAVAEVRLLRWPTTNTFLKDPNNSNSEIIGIPLTYDAGTGVMSVVAWGALDTEETIIKQVSHVRFTIYRGNSASKPRTVDLPCPSTIFKSPDSVAAGAPNAQSPTVLNPDGVSINVDNWSPVNLSYDTVTVSGKTHTIMGQFFYPPDFLAWIFGGTKVRFTYPNGDVEYAAAGATNKGGFAVPSSVSTPANATYDDGKQGWKNDLPVITRFQAIKYTTIKLFFDPTAYDKLQWVYRFVDGAFKDGDTVEELEGVSKRSDSGPANDGSPMSGKYRDLRLLTKEDLKNDNTDIQAMGPKRMGYITTSPFNSLNPSNFNAYGVLCPDPVSPMPLAITLGNTYRQIVNTTLFEDQACTDATVILFPSQGANDSLSAPLDMLAQDAYKLFGQAAGQGYSETYSEADYTALFPGDKTFSPANLSAIAAHGKNAEQPNFWGAPWKITRGGSGGRKIQTMVISVGVPGTYLWKGGNSGKSVPHEKLFQTAQWGDINRSKWGDINGNNPDASRLDNGQVFYYSGASPSDLEAALLDAVGYIVAARASLSAPATPSTGVRSATQAYFGTFKTARQPLWSGDLYGIGIKREKLWLDPADHSKGLEDKFGFYATGGISTLDVNGLSDFERFHLWSAYDIFGKYTATDQAGRVPPQTTGLVGTPLHWKSRIMYTSLGGSITSIPLGNVGDTSALPTALKNTVKKADGVTFITIAEANELIRWVRGAYKASVPADPNNNNFNRIDIMGDIINSAPLAVELTLSNDILPLVIQPDVATYKGGAFLDPHARLIIVGTNVGQLHCFVEATGAVKMADPVTGKAADDAGTPYQFVSSKATELWSFIPWEYWQAIYNLYIGRTTKDAAHLYMIDGDPALYHIDLPPALASQGTLPDTRVSKKENAVVIFGSRKGSRAFYALQISSTDGSVIPSGPKFIWKIDPQNPAASPTVGSPYSAADQALIKQMGMGTAIPAYAKVLTGSAAAPVLTDAVFIAGGYTNAQVNAQFKDLDPVAYANGLGKMILAVNPLTGAMLKSWDFTSGPAEMGGIAEGVTPARIFRDELAQRLYFADTNGNVWVIDTSIYSGIYRLDTSFIADWRTTPRALYKSSKNPSLPVRFTTRPEGTRIVGGFPVANADGVKPLTVMVAIGSSDRNNPTDRVEDYTIGATTFPVIPITANTILVMADRQDSKDLGIDSDGMILDTHLAKIDATWPTSYSSATVKINDPSYFLKTKLGYYIPLLDGSLKDAYLSKTHDKVMVSPLIKEGILYYSIYNISNSEGFDCSPNSFTRTFRQCDVLRPLYTDTQILDKRTVADVSNLDRNTDTCTGLAFFFNSLSSQLVDAGDQVIQGGARSDQSQTADPAEAYGAQTGQNRPHMENDPFPFARSGFRLRAWRVVR